MPACHSLMITRSEHREETTLGEAARGTGKGAIERGRGREREREREDVSSGRGHGPKRGAEEEISLRSLNRCFFLTGAEMSLEELP